MEYAVKKWRIDNSLYTRKELQVRYRTCVNYNLDRVPCEKLYLFDKETGEFIKAAVPYYARHGQVQA
jgi:hypothetical protein